MCLVCSQLKTLMRKARRNRRWLHEFIYECVYVVLSVHELVHHAGVDVSAQFIIVYLWVLLYRTACTMCGYP
jgi:hypothetical protein